MYFENIHIKDFRNYHEQDVKFDRNINIILGENAQGKTNLLEALYITSLGRSFRTSKDSELIRFGSDIAKVSTVLKKDGEKLSIDIGYYKNKKGIKIDGVKINKISELLDHVYVVIFSPDDMRIVKDEPEKRRKFIDRELCQMKPVYFDSLMRYKKTLAQRNSLLKSEFPDEGVLDIWDKELAIYGAKIIIYREKFIEKLSKISSRIHSDLTDKKENINIFYEANVKVAEDEISQRKVLEASFFDARKKDMARKTTSCGPHRDDLGIKVDGTDVRKFGSQGQQRTAALSLKLAEIRLIEEEKGEKPVLLLDDVLSELDSKRQKKLISSFGDIQIFITATELSDDIKNQLGDFNIIRIENGNVI